MLLNNSSLVKLVLIFLTITVLCSCGSSQHKYTGVSLVGTSQKTKAKDLGPILELSSNSIAVMPFAYENAKDAQLIYSGLDWQWWGEKPEGIREQIDLAHSKGLNVMIKPQVWRFDGTYTGLLAYNNEQDWTNFEKDYLEFILIYARMAEETQSDLLCIGTELGAFVKARPDFWQRLIQQVKKIYNGKLTYASNWDDYTRFPFWTELDYIGVDAYFPLSNEQTPSIQTCREAWNEHALEMEELSDQYHRPILFTEWGFRSMDYCAKEPWNYQVKNQSNLLAQKNAIAATFESVWKAPWFAGGFLWKWFPNNDRSGGPNDKQFTPQNKPALETIKSYFKLYNTANP